MDPAATRVTLRCRRAEIADLPPPSSLLPISHRGPPPPPPPPPVSADSLAKTKVRSFNGTPGRCKTRKGETRVAPAQPDTPACF